MYQLTKVLSGLLLFLFLSCTSAGIQLAAQTDDDGESNEETTDDESPIGGENTTVEIGTNEVVLPETGVKKHQFFVPVSRFESLIDQYLTTYEEAIKEGRERIAGFIFIPYFDTVGIQGFETSAYHVYLASWVGAEFNQHLKLFGTTNIEAAFNRLEIEDPNENYSIIVDSLNPIDFTGRKEQWLIQNSEEFRLVFLDYADYLYLAEGLSYYTPDLQEQVTDDPSIRYIVGQRMLAAQMFRVSQTGEIDTLENHRSLSFWPEPAPMFAPSEESTIAYRDGYHCPPYWDEQNENLIAERGSNNDGFQFFYQAQSDVDTSQSSVIEARNLLKTVEIFSMQNREARGIWQANTQEGTSGDKDLPWFLWAALALIILLLIIIIFRVYKAPSSGSSLNDLISTEPT